VSHPLERIRVRNLKSLANEVQKLLEARLWAQVLVAMVLGIGVGVALGPSTGWVAEDTASVIAEWMALPGELFLAVIKMIVVPLVVASVVRGIAASGDPGQLKSTGSKLLLYFVVTAVIATSLGIAVGTLIRPGAYVAPELVAGLTDGQVVDGLAAVTEGEGEGSASAITGAVTGLIPTNPLSAMSQGEMLQVVIFAFIFGIALVALEPESSRPLLQLMGSLQEVSMKVVSFMMRFAPIAVFGLLGRTMMETGIGVLLSLGLYALTVIVALTGLLVLYLFIVSVLGRRNPLRFLGHIRDAQLLAFSTGSSAATMPVSLRVAEEKVGIRPSTSQLVIPMGATVNMGGTACFHGVATLFMAQLFGIDLATGALLALVATSLGSSIGAPASPGVGIAILATVLTGVGIPLAGIALIMGIDQILERFRCVLNVTGDLVACTVMDRYVKAPRTLEEERARQEQLEDADADVVVDGGPALG